MNKQSSRYSCSIAGTYGHVYPKYGNYKSLAYLDQLLSEDDGTIGLAGMKHITKVFNRVMDDFSQLKNITNVSTRKHAAKLFADHYVKVIDETIHFTDIRIKSIMQNVVQTKRKEIIT